MLSSSFHTFDHITYNIRTFTMADLTDSNVLFNDYKVFVFILYKSVWQ